MWLGSLSEASLHVSLGVLSVLLSNWLRREQLLRLSHHRLLTKVGDLSLRGELLLLHHVLIGLYLLHLVHHRVIDLTHHSTSWLRLISVENIGNVWNKGTFDFRFDWRVFEFRMISWVNKMIFGCDWRKILRQIWINLFWI